MKISDLAQQVQQERRLGSDGCAAFVVLEENLEFIGLVEDVEHYDVSVWQNVLTGEDATFVQASLLSNYQKADQSLDWLQRTKAQEACRRVGLSPDDWDNYAARMCRTPRSQHFTKRHAQEHAERLRALHPSCTYEVIPVAAADVGEDWLAVCAFLLNYPITEPT